MAKSKSRADRFSEAIGEIENQKSNIEELRDELQSWKDNMPENLQNGSKADELQEAIDNLESCISSLDDAVGTDVFFPGMR